MPELIPTVQVDFFSSSLSFENKTSVEHFRMFEISDCSSCDATLPNTVCNSSLCARATSFRAFKITSPVSDIQRFFSGGEISVDSAISVIDQRDLFGVSTFEKVYSVHACTANYTSDNPHWKNYRHTSAFGDLTYRRRHKHTA